MIPFLLALTFVILLTLVFVIPGSILLSRFGQIVGSDDVINMGVMKVPTFYSMVNKRGELGLFIFFPVVGVIFGGIHCLGWFFNFPSSDEAILWRVSSAVITGIPFLSPLVTYLLLKFHDLTKWDQDPLVLRLCIIALLVEQGDLP